MPYAYHVVFSTYGFWLPNDPRGSGSDFVRNARLLPYGLATGTNHTRSVAHDRHDVAVRRLAKEALQYPPVIFDDGQIACVARGLAHRVRRSGIKLWACAVMPDHVHLALPEQGASIEQTVGLLKGAATYQLREENRHPLRDHPDGKGSLPSPWGQGLWKVFLDTETDVAMCVDYVKTNPIKAGMGAQEWEFVRRFCG